MSFFAKLYASVNLSVVRLLPVITSLTALMVGSTTVEAQPIFVPNHSFNSPSAPMVSPYVTTQVSSWQKPAKPAYFDFVEQNYGIFWDQTTGIFFGPGAYGNMDGIQAAFVLAWPQAGIFQDYDTMDYNDPVPSHDFDASFGIGKSYTLTVGVYGKGFSGFNMTEGSMLGLSLYYRDGANQVTIGTPTIITYSSALFPSTGSLNLLDYSVVIPTVQAGDAWAGKHIGVRIESIYGVGDGYWDIDNVRLTAVPEPSTLGLAMIGGLLMSRRRNRN